MTAVADLFAKVRPTASEEEDFDISTVDFDTVDPVEEFYNSCHLKSNGKFCGGKGKKGRIQVPMSAAARKSNAILRGLSAARKSKDYKQAKKNIKGKWSDRETGQGGLRGVKGTSSKKADAARAANAKTGTNTKKWKKDPQLANIMKKYG